MYHAICLHFLTHPSTTDLGGALTLVINEHFDTNRIKPGYPPGHAPTTILVITCVPALC